MSAPAVSASRSLARWQNSAAYLLFAHREIRKARPEAKFVGEASNWPHTAARLYISSEPLVGLAAMSPVDTVPIRKYRSRKQKPCDNCRRRRVCCVRDAEGDCALCSRRSIPCTFSSEPERRPRRPKRDDAPEVAVHSLNTNSSRHSVANPVVSVAPMTPNTGAFNRVQPLNGRRGVGEGKYIGLTGTEDVYFDVERDPVIGNDPAKEAYFRVLLPYPVVLFSLSDNILRAEHCLPHPSCLIRRHTVLVR